MIYRDWKRRTDEGDDGINNRDMLVFCYGMRGFLGLGIEKSFCGLY